MATVAGVLAVLVFVGLAYLAGSIARGKGRPFWLYLVAGLVLGPIALIVALLIPRRRMA